MEHFVFSSDLKTAKIGIYRGKETVVNLELDVCFSVFKLHALISRRNRADTLKSIIIYECEICKAVSDLLLLSGMDGTIFTDVYGGGHSAVRYDVK